MRVGAKHPAYAEVLYNVQTPLAPLVLGHKRLWPGQTSGYVVLGNFPMMVLRIANGACVPGRLIRATESRRYFLLRTKRNLRIVLL